MWLHAAAARLADSSGCRATRARIAARSGYPYSPRSHHDQSQGHLVRRTEFRAAPRRDLRSGGRNQGRAFGPVVDHRRRRHRQDQHPRAPRGPSRVERHRSRANLDAHLHPARSAGDDPPDAGDRRREPAGTRDVGRGGRRVPPAVVGDLSRRRKPHPQAVRRASRTLAALHGSRPLRRGRCHGRGAPRSGFLVQGEALSAQGCLPRHLQLPDQHPTVAQADAGRTVPVVPRMGGGSHATLPGIRGAQAGRSPARL